MERFTQRRSFPLGPMPCLRLERAPLRAPGSQGWTERAVARRACQRHAALLAHTEYGIQAKTEVQDDLTGEEREIGQIWSTIATIAFILVLVGSVALL